MTTIQMATAGAAAFFLYALVKLGGKSVEGKANATGQMLVDRASIFMGRPYFLGAGQNSNYPDPPYLDCALFTKKILAPYGVNVQRTVTEQVAAAPYTREISGKSLSEIRSMLKIGDFIGFDWTPGGRYSHTGIWTGTKVKHASSTAGKVVDSPLSYFSLSGFRTIYSFTR